MSCKTTCEACMCHEWDFFHVPDKHSSGGVPECVLNLGEGPEYDGYPCICEDSMNWTLHLKVWHNPTNGECAELGEGCPQWGMVTTVDGETRLADDPKRNWTEHEIDEGVPWK